MSNSVGIDHGALEVARLRVGIESIVAEFFAVLHADPEAASFHPHAMTAEEAARLCRLSGKDLYYLMQIDSQGVAYGMLRGWDEGFNRPSLGIAVHPAYRGIGLGRMLMEFLHSAARCRGADEVILKVYQSNRSAVALYRSLGYVFEEMSAHEWRGVLRLR